MKSRLNIALVVPGIDLCGGIEHFGCGLANWLADRGHRITIFTTPPKHPNKRSILPLHNLIDLNYFNYTTPEITRGILQKLDPDLCAIFYSYRSAIYWGKVLHNTAIPLLYSEHNDPVIIENVRWNRLERIALITASDTMHLLIANYLESVPAPLRKRVHIIPNFCRYSISKIDRANRRERVLLSLGRLDRNSKQLHLLIDAFALIKNDHPLWKLQIWGEGRDYHRLQSLIQKNDLNDVVQLKGETTEAELQYRESDLFCIPSRFEGFPLTPIEAMAHGLPVVGFAECSGVNLVVQDGVNGVLVSKMTAESLAQALSKLMGDDELRQKMSEAALVRAADFDKEIILTQWEEMIYECASHKGDTALQRAFAELEDPESNAAQLNLLWRLNTTFEERMEYFSYPLIQYVHYKRDKWFVKWPWKLILTLWKAKERVKSRLQKNEIK